MLFFLAVLIWSHLIPLHAENVMLFAAASLSDSLKAVAKEYEKSGADKIIFNFASSSILERQIEEGAPADIFFSADESHMDLLAKKALIDSSTRKSLLGNSLVVVVSLDSILQIVSAASLTNAEIKRIALGETRTVPAGVYAKRWLESKNLWATLEPRVIPCENVRAALAAVESGNADVGVVYKTDAGISRKAKVAYQVPEREAPSITYPVAMIQGSQRTLAAKKFLDYLSSSHARDVFVKSGFKLLP